MKLSKIAFVIMLSGVVFSLTRCGKKEEKKSIEANFTSLYSNVFSDCSNCHAAGNERSARYPDLDFTSKETAYKSIVDVTPSSLTGCGSFKYIASGSPDNSIAYVVLDKELVIAFKGKNGTECKITEPDAHGLTAGSAEALSAVKTWITNGAKND